MCPIQSALLLPRAGFGLSLKASSEGEPSTSSILRWTRQRNTRQRRWLRCRISNQCLSMTGSSLACGLALSGWRATVCNGRRCGLGMTQKWLYESSHPSPGYHFIFPFLCQAMALGAQPQHLPSTLGRLGAAADELWYRAGDVSTDLHWYSRRALLVSGACVGSRAKQRETTRVGDLGCKTTTSSRIPPPPPPAQSSRPPRPSCSLTHRRVCKTRARL